MTPELWWEIAKYVLSGIALIGSYIVKTSFSNINTQITAIWKRVDELQAAETKKQIDLGVLNLQVTTLTSQMAGVQGELQKLNIQTAKLDTILEMLEKHGN